MNNIDQYAVFGHPIKHSKSPQIHKLFAAQTSQQLTYDAQEVSAELFDQSITDFFTAGGKGVNCTVPLKELAWQRADSLSERAKYAKAVNTLLIQDDGSLYGENTDGVGLVTDLTINHSITLCDKKILILGAGGASRGIIAPLFEKSPLHIVIANRTVDKALTLSNEFSQVGEVIGCGYDELNNKQFDLIINATSASLSGELPPLSANLLAKQGQCYDLAYANQPTAFVKWGLAHAAEKSVDGLGMLVEQAAEAFYLWRGVRPKTKEIITLLNSQRMQNS